LPVRGEAAVAVGDGLPGDATIVLVAGDVVGASLAPTGWAAVLQAASSNIGTANAATMVPMRLTFFSLSLGASMRWIPVYEG
jgi:hypothetical protein